MKIAIVGGTGDCGRGFIHRWAESHEMIVGSRKAEKAEEVAKNAKQYLQSHGIEASIKGTDNRSAVEESDMAVLTLPFQFVKSTLLEIAECFSDQVVVSPLVPMSRKGKHFVFAPPAQGSAALLVQELLPASVRIVASFHTISHKAFEEKDRVLNGDVIMCGDDKEAKEMVAGLAKTVRNLRPLDGGPLEVASQLEALTPMLLNLSRLNKVRNAGIEIVEC
ncbi:MAG: NADPH-dependent F420 reductase [Methanotrichaceae archaeon]|nr:NADPH-dependent F420 reductase [Methanotrichaceae archaeon]